MPALPDRKFHKTGENGDVLEFTSKVSVDGHGTFSMTIPDELEDLARDKCRDARHVSVGRPKKFLRVSGPELDACRKVIGLAMDAYLDCEVMSELVIEYSAHTDFAAWKAADGSFYPNGSFCKGIRGGPGWIGNLNATKVSGHYSIGLYARVMQKVTYSRGGNEKVELKRVNDLPPESFGYKLNGFIGMAGPRTGAKEMPYTEEAARFFHDTIMAIVVMAGNLRTFFDNESSLLKSIEQGATNNLLPFSKGETNAA